MSDHSSPPNKRRIAFSRAFFRFLKNPKSYAPIALIAAIVYIINLTELPRRVIENVESVAQTVGCQGDLPTDPQIRRAISEGDLVFVDNFLEACGDPGHTLRPESITATQLAAQNGQWPVLKEFLAQRWPWKRIDGSVLVDSQNNNLLHLAVTSCDGTTIRELFSRWRFMAAEINDQHLRPDELLARCSPTQDMKKLYRLMLNAVEEFSALPMLITSAHAKEFDELNDIQHRHLESIRTAVRMDDPERVIGLIELGSALFDTKAPIGPFDTSGTTLAGVTVLEGQIGVLAAILNHYPQQTDLPNKLGRTPLMLSVDEISWKPLLYLSTTKQAYVMDPAASIGLRTWEIQQQPPPRWF